MAKRVPGAVEKQFNDDGIFFLEERGLHSILGSKEAAFCVKVELRLADTAVIPEIDFSYSVVNRRGVAIIFTDFEILKRDTGNHLAFTVACRGPADAIALLPTGVDKLDIGMTFLDLCFYTGNEAIPENYANDVYTTFRPIAVKADIGWYLPIRFCDPFIEAMSKMNNAVFGGMLQESIIYGPFSKVN